MENVSAQTPSSTHNKFSRQTSQGFVRKRDGKLIDYYRVGKQLGKGAYGSVHRVVNIETGETRAVKVISKAEMHPDEIITLYNEMNILRNLDHPNIVKIYEYFEDEKRFYIVMELCKGGELFKMIIDNKISEEDSAKIMLYVLSTVNYTHINKIVHRDLKPENILMDKDLSAYDELKIIDFGTSRFYDPKLRSDLDKLNCEDEDDVLREIIGTPYYIAPEVLNQ